jgi:four helix bundle protein
MRRAATSIALNIAEGQGDTNAQFNRFLQIAQGSIKECLVCLTIAERQEFIDLKNIEPLKKDALLLAKMISSLQNYLKRQDNLARSNDNNNKTKD